MKHKIRSFVSVALAAAALLALPACSNKQETQAVSASTATTSAIKTVAAELPTAFRTKLAALVSSHPSVAKYAAETASALDKAQIVVGDLPSPTTLNLYLLWTKFDPSLADFASGFEALYAEFYGTFPADGAALGAIAQIIGQAGTSTPTATPAPAASV